MPIPPIIPINNYQVLVKRRKRAKRNAIICAIVCAIVCFVTIIGITWWVSPGVWQSVDLKLNAIIPDKRKILNKIDDQAGSNKWKLKEWGKPISTDHLQINRRTYIEYNNGTLSHRYTLSWDNCMPGRTMRPLIVERYLPAFGWCSVEYCAFVTEKNNIYLIDPKYIRKRDEPGWSFMSGE